MALGRRYRAAAVWLAAVVVTWIGAGRLAFGNPVFGEPWKLRQPDGSMVDVRIWGDEFYQVVESMDGWTLVRDPRSLAICYARLSPDEADLLSTGVAIGQGDPAALGLPRHLRIRREASEAQATAARQAFALAEEEARKKAGLTAPPKTPAAVTGSVFGLCLIVDFSDQAATITPTAVDNFWNKVGYSANGNNGSVYDYYYDVSNHLLSYTNYVPSAYYRALQVEAYYDDPAKNAGPGARELIEEALNDLKSQGFDFSPYDDDGDGYIDVINCLYAGSCHSGWAKGLWPHTGGGLNFNANGVSANSYEITNMGSALHIGTACHENGHLVCGFPDLYDYDYDSQGVGNFCLMCSGSFASNPVQPCAPLRFRAGWVTPADLDTPQAGLSLTVGPVYLFSHPTRSNEYYMIENRQKTGRDANIADQGLAIWHWDTYGDNDWQDMTRTSHYKCSLEQADGDYDLENDRAADSTDLFAATAYRSFTPFTSPPARWWDGERADLYLANISASGATMTFDFGVGLTVSDHTDYDPCGPAGGPWVKANKTYTLTNNGAAAVNWTALETAAWLDVAPASGSLAPSATVDVKVSINAGAASLAPGVYPDTVQFRNTAANRQLGRNVELFVQDFAPLPFTEDFESGSLAPCWRLTGTNQWRTRVTTGNNPRGAYHLLMDDWNDQNDYSRNEATLGVNVAGQQNCVLTFYAKYYGNDRADAPPPSPFTDGANFDGVAMSVDGTHWYEIQALRGAAITTSYKKFTVDLDAALAAAGLPHSPALRIRFNQYDNRTVANDDGIAIDDIKVAGVPSVSAAKVWQAY
ncbi:MAG: M6 family metalloprotease domain-containing protein [Candidatus Sumerlaeota bacterium]|nr:M6 family metalloprotease domain-containing protein [Candidatus Sumerlaeota bacterium]